METSIRISALTAERDGHEKRANGAYSELFEEKQAVSAAEEKLTSISALSDDQAVKLTVLKAAMESADFQHQKKISEMEETHKAAMALLLTDEKVRSGNAPSGNNEITNEELRAMKEEIAELKNIYRQLGEIDRQNQQTVIQQNVNLIDV